MMDDQLDGVFSALVTPFTPDGKDVDEARLRSLVDSTIEAGIDGLLPCGSTGEFTSLSDGERRRVTQVVCEQAAGRVPVMAQTGALTSADASDLSVHAEQAGASAVLLIAPFYDPLSLDEVRGYYAAVAESTTLPIGVYNLPSGSGRNLEPEFLAQLAQEIPSVTFVKESAGDLTQLGRLVFDYSDVLTVFNGWDTLLLPALEWGTGAIVGVTNVLPKQCAELAKATRAGRYSEAVEMWGELYPAMQFLITAGNYAAAVKGALECLGQSAGPTRAPVAALPPQAQAELKVTLARWR